MSKRAKRLGDYLSVVLGWEVWVNDKNCNDCGYRETRNVKYCCRCGGELVNNKNSQTKIIDDLEEAICFALSNKRIKKED